MRRAKRFLATCLTALLVFSTLANDCLVASAEEIIEETEIAESEEIEKDSDTKAEEEDLVEEIGEETIEETTEEIIAEGAEEVVSEETEDVSESSEEAEETIEAGEESEEVNELPAYDFGTFEAGGMKVSISAPEGAFPEGTTVEVVAASYSEEKLEGQLADDESVVDAKAVDITFYNDGEEIQPEKAIYVVFSDADLEGDNVAVYHEEKDGEIVEVDATGTSADGAAIMADSFSVYIVVATGKDKVAAGTRTIQSGVARIAECDKIAGDKGIGNSKNGVKYGGKTYYYNDKNMNVRFTTGEITKKGPGEHVAPVVKVELYDASKNTWVDAKEYRPVYVEDPFDIQPIENFEVIFKGPDRKETVVRMYYTNKQGRKMNPVFAGEPNAKDHFVLWLDQSKPKPLDITFIRYNESDDSVEVRDNASVKFMVDLYDEAANTTITVDDYKKTATAEQLAGLKVVDSIHVAAAQTNISKDTFAAIEIPGYTMVDACPYFYYEGSYKGAKYTANAFKNYGEYSKEYGTGAQGRTYGYIAWFSNELDTHDDWADGTKAMAYEKHGTLHVVFKKDADPEYTLTIKPNGGIYAGKDTDTVITMKEGEEYTVADAVAKAGQNKIFAGWDKTGTADFNAETGKFVMGTEDAVLTAKYNPVYYNVEVYVQTGAGFVDASAEKYAKVLMNENKSKIVAPAGVTTVTAAELKDSFYPSENASAYRFNADASDRSIAISCEKNAANTIKLYYDLNSAVITLDKNFNKEVAYSVNGDAAKYYKDHFVKYDAAKATLTYTAASTAFALPTASANGYQFIGWKENNAWVVNPAKNIGAAFVINPAALAARTFVAQWVEAGPVNLYLIRPNHENVGSIKRGEKLLDADSTESVKAWDTNWYSPSVGTADVTPALMGQYKSYSTYLGGVSAMPTAFVDNYVFISPAAGSKYNTTYNAEKNVISMERDGYIYEANTADIDWYVVKKDTDGWHVDGEADWEAVDTVEHTINYVARIDGAVASDFLSKTSEKAKYTEALSTVTAPTWTDDTVYLLGWSWSESAVQSKTFGDVVSGEMPNKDITVYVDLASKTEITLKADNLTKVYDGTSAVKNDTASVTEGALKVGHNVSVVTEAETVINVTDDGIGKHTIQSYAITDENDEDVAEQYIVTLLPGNITITPAGLAITISSVDKEYDAAFVEPEVTITGLKSDDALSVVITNAIKDVQVDEEGNPIAVPIEYELIWSKKPANVFLGLLNKFSAAEKPTNNNYDINIDAGSMKLTPAALQVVTKSANKEYDGKALKAKGSISGFKGADYVEFKTTGSQITVGSSKNKYAIKWTGAKATNYVIEEKLGKLVVSAPYVPEEPTPTPGPGGEPTPTPTNIPDEPTPTGDGAGVLGARRGVEADGASVLGARREQAVLGARRGAATGDTNAIAFYMMMMGASASLAGVYSIARRKKRGNAE